MSRGGIYPCVWLLLQKGSSNFVSFWRISSCISLWPWPWPWPWHLSFNIGMATNLWHSRSNRPNCCPPSWPSSARSAAGFSPVPKSRTWPSWATFMTWWSTARESGAGILPGTTISWLLSAARSCAWRRHGSRGSSWMTPTTATTSFRSEFWKARVWVGLFEPFRTVLSSCVSPI